MNYQVKVVYPVDTRYCGDIDFLLGLHRNVDRLHINIEVTS